MLSAAFYIFQKLKRRKSSYLNIMFKHFMTLLLMTMALLFGSNLDAQAAYAENVGIITRDAPMYVAASTDATYIGEIKKDSLVEIISTLDSFVIIKQGDLYAYVPYADVLIVDNYEKRLGAWEMQEQSYGVLLTDGSLYENSVDTLMQAYSAVPEKVRKAFEENGFKIKMTEWDVCDEAYAPYGEYSFTNQLYAVFDYERKMLYVNDEWPNAILHEMGHFINDYLQMYSARPKAMELWRTESGKISYYAQSNDREFFAEAFRLYIAEPQLLILMSPDVYAMVNDVINIFPESMQRNL